MVLQFEHRRLRHFAQSLVERPLGGCRQGHIGDLPTRGADEVVVMVVGDLFTQLVMGVLVTHRDLADQASVFEHGEIAVHRTLGQGWFTTKDHRDGDWSAGLFERAENQLPASGEPLTVLAEAVERDVIDVSDHEHSVYIMHLASELSGPPVTELSFAHHDFGDRIPAFILLVRETAVQLMTQSDNRPDVQR